MCEMCQPGPICRACLRSSAECVALQAAFVTASGGTQDVSYLDCFRICTQITDVESVEYLCDTCAFELRICYDFVEKARNSDRILRESRASGRAMGDETEKLLELSMEVGWCSDTQASAGEDGADGADITAVAEPVAKGAAEEEQDLSSTYTYTTIDVAIEDRTKIDPDMELLVESGESCDANDANDVPERPVAASSGGTLAVAAVPAYNCSVCAIGFSTKADCKKHQWQVHNSAVSCEICSEQLPITETMRQHIRRKHAHIVQCKKCAYQDRESKMVEHEQKVHGNLPLYQCNICSKTFTSFHVYGGHMKHHQRKKLHTKSDACTVCGKQFSTQNYLSQHMVVHLQERKLYKCDDCEKIYVSKTSLENHIRIHKGDALVCSICSKPFARKYELNVHMRFHTRDYPFECEVCQKRFAIKGHLRTHMWRHQGLKLQCEACGKLFTSTKALHEHSFMHTGMPFPCSYCPRGFPSKQKFKKHLLAVHTIEIDDNELDILAKKQPPRPLHRKKMTLVQTDSVEQEQEQEQEHVQEDVDEADEEGTNISANRTADDLSGFLIKQC